jgi:hypothetical protein
MSDTAGTAPDTSETPDPGTTTTDADASECNVGSTYNGSLGLRVGAIFIILVTSLCVLTLHPR